MRRLASHSGGRALVAALRAATSSLAHSCANVPEVFWRVVVGIACAVGGLGVVGRGRDGRGWRWETLGSVGNGLVWCAGAEFGGRVAPRGAANRWEKTGSWALCAGLQWCHRSWAAQGRQALRMLEDNADRWISRQELAQRYGVPVKTPAEWASKGTGPRYAKFGRYVRYRLTDVIDWEQARLTDQQRKPGEEPGVVKRSDAGRGRDGQG